SLRSLESHRRKENRKDVLEPAHDLPPRRRVRLEPPAVVEARRIERHLAVGIDLGPRYRLLALVDEALPARLARFAAVPLLALLAAVLEHDLELDGKHDLALAVQHDLRDPGCVLVRLLRRFLLDALAL